MNDSLIQSSEAPPIAEATIAAPPKQSSQGHGGGQYGAGTVRAPPLRRIGSVEPVLRQIPASVVTQHGVEPGPNEG